MAASASLALLAGVGWLMTQSTLPALQDEKGNVIAGSISEQFYTTLNGRQEWIVVRGVARNGPIVIYLHGGPGSTDFGLLEKKPSLIEQNAILVIWHQTCSGRSYPFFGSCDGLNHEMIVSDLDALVDYLRARFNNDQVYLLGHSWGSVISMMYASKHPEKLSAVLTVGQATSTRAMTDWNYRFALSKARSRNHIEAMNELLSVGPPTYDDENGEIRSLLDMVPELLVHRKWVEEFRGRPPVRERDPLERAQAEELTHISRLDRIRAGIALRRVLGMMGKEILNVDLRDSVSEVQVPVYFYLGRLDPVNPPELAEEYFNKLISPRKRLVWFEQSAHAPQWGRERAAFEREVVAAISETGARGKGSIQEAR